MLYKITKYDLSYNNPYKSINSCSKSNINGKKSLLLFIYFLGLSRTLPDLHVVPHNYICI